MEKSCKSDEDYSCQPQINIIHTRQKRVIGSYIQENLEGKQRYKHPNYTMML